MRLVRLGSPQGEEAAGALPSLHSWIYVLLKQFYHSIDRFFYEKSKFQKQWKLLGAGNGLPVQAQEAQQKETNKLASC